jgi:hypothetical protein
MTDSTGGSQQPAEQAASSRLPVDAGMCGNCRYAAVKATRRGTAYLRCTRAAWDDRLVRYPRLPVSECAGFAGDSSPKN